MNQNCRLHFAKMRKFHEIYEYFVKPMSYLKTFSHLFREIFPLFFTRIFRNFWRIFRIFRKIVVFSISRKFRIFSQNRLKRNAKMKRNGREKCEIFAKRFFLFAGTPNPGSLLGFSQGGCREGCCSVDPGAPSET